MGGSLRRTEQGAPHAREVPAEAGWQEAGQVAQGEAGGQEGEEVVGHPESLTETGVELPVSAFDLRVLLAAVEAAAPVDAVDVLAAQLARIVQATDVSLLIANFSGDAVVRMSHVSAGAPGRSSSERTESVPLAGSPFERVLGAQRMDVTPVDGRWRVLVPVTERGDAIGVLQLVLLAEPGPEVLAYLAAAGHALAYVLVASRRHTDIFEAAQRDIPFSLAAEIQRRLLPAAYTLETGAFSLAGWLEPAATVGGDTFDYSVDREHLYVSLTDAMGHAEEASLLATLTVGSLRNSRRSLVSPAEQAYLANAALLRVSRDDQFVTGLVARLRLDDGLLEIVNAGHPPPFLLRRGKGSLLEVAPSTAFGIVDGPYEPSLHQLEPGDRLLFVTDGFLERNAVTVDIVGTLQSTADRHPREIVRELAAHVLAATGGVLLDDAASLCLDWHGPGADRRASGGASDGRATGA